MVTIIETQIGENEFVAEVYSQGPTTLREEIEAITNPPVERLRKLRDEASEMLKERKARETREHKDSRDASDSGEIPDSSRT